MHVAINFFAGWVKSLIFLDRLGQPDLHNIYTLFTSASARLDQVYSVLCTQCIYPALAQLAQSVYIHVVHMHVHVVHMHVVCTVHVHIHPSPGTCMYVVDTLQHSIVGSCSCHKITIFSTFCP